MVSTPELLPRLHGAGVVTCVVVETTGCEPAGNALAREGAAMVVPTGEGMIGAFQRVTDALRAAFEVRLDMPDSKVALCTGETGTRGEFGVIADKATRLLTGAAPGSTVLSRLAGVLAMDHLPRDRVLLERSTADDELSYELRTA